MGFLIPASEIEAQTKLWGAQLQPDTPTIVASDPRPTATPRPRPTVTAVEGSTYWNVPDCPDATGSSWKHRTEGLLHIRGGSYEAAIAELNIALCLSPRYPDSFRSNEAHYYSLLAEAYWKLGQRQRSDQHKATGVLLQGIARIEANTSPNGWVRAHQEAIQDYDEAIRLNPQFALAYFNRGLAYQELDQHLLATRDYDEAIRLDTTFMQFFP